jgi:hypothetical protein
MQDQCYDACMKPKSLADGCAEMAMKLCQLCNIQCCTTAGRHEPPPKPADLHCGQNHFLQG